MTDGSRLDLAQGLAVDLLAAVDAGQSLDRATAARADEFDKLGDHLRAVCREHCFGVLRNRGRLRAMLKPLLKGETQTFLAILLEVVAYELLYTRVAPHAAVDFAVRTAKSRVHPNVGGFVNAVLRNLIRQKEALSIAAHQTLEGCYSFPKWWIEQTQKDHPTRWRQILMAQNTPPPMTLRVNRRQVNRAAYAQQLSAAGLEAREIGEDGLILSSGVNVEALPGFDEGLVSVQDAAAQWAAQWLPARNGQRVLDACAAPGGKTAHLLERFDVSLLALDHDLKRLQRVERTLQRLQLRADVRCADAEKLSDWWDGCPFDHILLDAPCTGSGVTRRHPDIRGLRRPDDLERLSRLQLRLLKVLWKTLSPGGTLLYITCSTFRCEGPDVITAFLTQQEDAEREPLPAPLNAEGFLEPSEDYDGFFYARLRKI